MSTTQFRFGAPSWGRLPFSSDSTALGTTGGHRLLSLLAPVSRCPQCAPCASDGGDLSPQGEGRAVPALIKQRQRCFPGLLARRHE